MKYFSCVILIMLSLQLFGQKNTMEFTIDLHLAKTPHSLYNQIVLIDERLDTATVGVVKKGVVNREVSLLPMPILSKQIQDLLQSATDGTAADGRLILLLKNFDIYELTDFASEKGVCYLRAWLFAETQNGYSQIAYTDSIHIIQSLDVTKGLIKTGKAMLPSFILAHLQTASCGGENYTMNNLLHLDSILKSKIPLYANDSLKSGIYKTYHSFMQQTPDITDFEAFFKKDKFQYLALPNKKGKYEEPAPVGNYAFVYQGHTYIMTGEGVYVAEKKDGDFYFKGKYRVSKSESIIPYLLFGIVGAAIHINYTVRKGTAIINYENGSFISK